MNLLEMLGKPKDKSDFTRIARRNGWEVREGAGSHTVYKAPNGMIEVISQHHGEIPKQIRCKIIKKFVAMGAVIGAVYLLLPIIGG